MGSEITWDESGTRASIPLAPDAPDLDGDLAEELRVPRVVRVGDTLQVTFSSRQQALTSIDAIVVTLCARGFVAHNRWHQAGPTPE